MRKMGSNSDNIQYYEILSVRMNTAILFVHIFFLILFFTLNIKIMALVNVGSISLYSILFFLIKNKPVSYITFTYLEVCIHMALATLCLGWESGFHYYFITLLTINFYYDYLYKKNWGVSRYPKIISIIIVSIYVALKVYTYLNAPIYELNKKMIMYMSVCNIILFFAFIVICLIAFQTIIIQAESKLDLLANQDELTGLKNRRYMLKTINKLVNQESIEKEQIALGILDIDDFKLVNDTYGHNAGDYILQEVSKLIMSNKNDKIMICRWGGEEFLVLGTGILAYERVKEFAQKMVFSIHNQQYKYEDQKIEVSLTAGVTKYREREAVDQLISRVDEYMYSGKKKGKNQMVSDFE